MQNKVSYVVIIVLAFVCLVLSLSIGRASDVSAQTKVPSLEPAPEQEGQLLGGVTVSSEETKNFLADEYVTSFKMVLKDKNKDVAYFAVDGVENQVVMFDIKRGNVKSVILPPTALVPVRCVSERDLLAEKNVSRDDMTLTDSRDGKKYKVEEKAGRLWMTANLRFSLQSAKQCFLEDTLFCKKHGRFYTYHEAKKACPPGWHLPDDGEWRDYQKESVNWDNLGVGGCRDWDEYCDEATTGHYWSSTSITKNTGRSWEFRRKGKNINRTDESTQKGLYVRCVAGLE